jgi:hypothetical protein
MAILNYFWLFLAISPYVTFGYLSYFWLFLAISPYVVFGYSKLLLVILT